MEVGMVHSTKTLGSNRCTCSVGLIFGGAVPPDPRFVADELGYIEDLDNCHLHGRTIRGIHIETASLLTNIWPVFSMV
jgi:hypothetical protein